MQLNVVGKIVVGFGIFGCLLLVTNIFSYFGLADIRQSAETVITEKMPVQSQMLDVQTGILSLAKISTNGFHEQSLDGLTTNQQSFATLAQDFSQKLEQLRRLIGTQSAEFREAEAMAQGYIEQSNQMYLARAQQLQLDIQIAKQSDQILSFADEASALMMDLSYLESDAPNLETLIGTGTNIDNKLVPILNSTKEFVTVSDPGLSETIRGDIEFAISNINVESDYLYRLAEDIETDGVVDAFSDQYSQLKAAFAGASGLFVLQGNKINLIEQAADRMAQAERNLDGSIELFASMFSRVNQDTLSGQNAIMDEVQSNIWKSVAAMVVALAAVVILGSLAARSIAKPLARINKSLAVISSGDLTHKADTSGNDEFSVLATSVNQLSASLHKVVSQIIAKEAQLEKATRASVELGEKTLYQVDQQREQVGQTANYTQTVRATSQSNLEQIHFAMEKLSQVGEQSESASDLVRQTNAQISDQAAQAETSSTVIHRLEDNSRKIGSILDVIKTIAEQTNLLALNAAIEAARAGEQGRGFAVVADEVRTLATRTHDSTEEIESMIASLQRDAEQAVQAISLGSQQAQQSVGLIQHVDEQVAQIRGIIDELNQVNQQIVSDTNEQDGLLQSVADSLSRIVSLAEQSASSTEQSNQATQQVDGLMHDLKQAVTKFKL